MRCLLSSQLPGVPSSSRQARRPPRPSNSFITKHPPALKPRSETSSGAPELPHQEKEGRRQDTDCADRPEGTLCPVSHPNLGPTLPTFRCSSAEPKHSLLTKTRFSESSSFFKMLKAGETTSLGRFFQQLISHVLKMYVYLLI